ncbi:MAG TPA: hypothetical protein VHF01_10360 [Candidatus Acidoferrum sp.]|nr:hypothetical protein [Candidatus Acidoferrum sp.]
MRRTNILSISLVIILTLSACSGLSKKGVGNQQVIVTVTPAAPTVNDFATQQFTAKVTGSANTAVTWQVNGVAGGSQATGFVSSAGLFVAPGAVPTKSDGKGNSIPTTVTVTAVSQASASASNFATVTIVPQNQNVQSGAIKLGSSGGNAKDSSTNGTKITCCGGTLGSLLTRNGAQFILSNNHVFAGSDSALVGDLIIQPGLIDNPKPNTCTTAGTTTVANLTQFFNLETGPTPKVDAAIAQVVNNTVVDPGGNIFYLGATATNGIPDPGAPHAGSGLAATVGMQVAKSGRTTGLTCSSVLATTTASTVQYQKGCGTGATFSVSYTNLVDVLGGNFSAEGDSGSLIVTQNTADPVALLFAGSDQDTVGNPISAVLNSGAFLGAGNAVPSFVGSATPHAVIGCTLPVKLAGAMQTLAATAVASEKLQQATVTRDAHAPELLSHPEVQAVGVGASFDNPAEAAILFFVTKGQPRTNIPAQVDGIRTRIIEGDLFASRGALSVEESAALEKSAAPTQLVYAISEAEVARAKVVHTAHVEELLKRPGVQGVGISSSVDSPGEAALMIFLIRGVAHDPIPPVIDGLRTRVRESSRFRAGFGGAVPHRACSLPVRNNAKTGSTATPSKH